jgi:hypothetical protein
VTDSNQRRRSNTYLVKPTEKTRRSSTIPTENPEEETTSSYNTHPLRRDIKSTQTTSHLKTTKMARTTGLHRIPGPSKNYVSGKSRLRNPRDRLVYNSYAPVNTRG